jgi:hypothetical protein
MKHEVDYPALRKSAELFCVDAEELNVVREEVARDGKEESKAAGQDQAESRED